jgi:hypothetical protein
MEIGTVRNITETLGVGERAYIASKTKTVNSLKSFHGLFEAF